MDGGQAPDRNIEEEPHTREQYAISGITFLRENRTSFDRPINERG